MSIISSLFRDNKLSIYVWLPCIWILLVKTRIFSIWQPLQQGDVNATVSAAAYAAGSAKAQIQLLILITIGLFCLWQRRINWLIIIKENYLLIIFFAYMGISILWSDYSFVSLKRYVKSVGMVIMGLVLLTENYPGRALAFMLEKTYTIAIIISAIWIFIIPSYGISQGIWVGVTTNKNALGQIVCMGSIFYLWRILTQNHLWDIKKIIMLLISTFILFNAQSTTSILAFLSAASLLLLSQFKIHKKYHLGIILLFYIFSYLLYSFYTNLYPESILVQIVTYFGKNMTFSGRDILWRDVLELANQRPWFGYGYESFWIGDIMTSLWEIHIWKPNQGHNGFIDVYATLGIVGLALLTIVIVGCFINCIVQFPVSYNFSRLRVALLFSLLYFNWSESIFCTSYTTPWLIFIIITMNRNEDTQIHIDKYD